MGEIRAGLYQRVSVLAKGADARSVEETNTANTAACERHGWSVAERYADPGRSASRFARRHREEYGRLMADLRAAKLDILILWESSRGSRELEEWARQLNVCREHGVKIYVTSHDRLYDLANGRDWRSLAEDGVDSAYESEKTSVRVRRGLAANAANGKPHGKTLFGYLRSYDPRTGVLTGQEPDPLHAPAVTEIVTRIAGGEPGSVIGKDLKRRAVASPEGGSWNSSAVRRVARNRAYIGRRVFKGAETPAIWPPLVDEATFWRAQRVLGDTAQPRARPAAARHELSYLARCGPCGGPLEGARIRGVPYYLCGEQNCTGIRQDWLDEYVLASAAVILDSPPFWEHLSRSSDTEVLAARGEADELRAELRENLELVKARKLSAASFAEIEAALLGSIAAADKRAEDVASPPALRGLGPGAGRAVLEAAPLAVRRKAMRELFAEITLLPAKHRGRQPFDPERVRIVPRWEASGDARLVTHPDGPPR